MGRESEPFLAWDFAAGYAVQLALHVVGAHAIALHKHLDDRFGK